MANRHRDQIKRRSSVLDRDQTDREAYQASSAAKDTEERARPFRKLIPLVIFASIAFLIAKEEIPAVNNWWERLVSPNHWLAKQTCQKAALDRVEHREFARVLRNGKVNSTRDGLYIDRLVIGEMAPSGAEEAVEYSCYLDREGKLVKLNRLQAATVAPARHPMPDDGLADE